MKRCFLSVQCVVFLVIVSCYFVSFYRKGDHSISRVWLPNNFINYDGEEPSSKIWVPFMEDQIFIFSAYYDQRKLEKTVIRVLLLKNISFNQACECLVWLDNGSSLLIGGNFDKMNRMATQEANFFNCPIQPKFNSTPKSVAMKCQGNISEFVSLTPSFVPPNRRHLLSVCVQPFFDYQDWLRLIVFIEYYKVVGVTHFVFYNQSISMDVDMVLRFYQRNGDAQIVQMPSVPRMTEDDEENRQILNRQGPQMNDCNLRIANLTRFWVSIDVDEFIAIRPLNEKNSLKDFFSSSKIGPNLGGVKIRSAFWSGDWPKVSSIKEFTKNDLLELELFDWFSVGKYYPTWHRTKIVVRPEAVLVKSVHDVFEYMDGFGGVQWPTDELVVFHLRNADDELERVNPFALVSRLVIGNVADVVEKIRYVLY